jgi:hypothetical protein
VESKRDVEGKNVERGKRKSVKEVQREREREKI